MPAIGPVVYPLGKSSRISFISEVLAIWVFRKARLRLVLFLPIKCPACDLRNLTFPDPVLQNRLAAARFVFIFGIFCSSSLAHTHAKWSILLYIKYQWRGQLKFAHAIQLFYIVRSLATITAN